MWLKSLMKRRYVTCTGEGAELCDFFLELCIGNVVGCILSNRDPNRKQNVAEVVQSLAEEPPVADLVPYTYVFEQCEHFVDVLDMIFEFLREDKDFV